MIKKFINKLFGKDQGPKADKRYGKRVEVPYAQHRIDRSLIDDNAIDVVETLKEGGFEAYIVGGAVRDLLTGLKPKDFDVATNATPEQVKRLFRRAFIIGRRFRIVHVIYGRDVIEVSTFRANLDSADAEQVRGDERSKEALAGKSHAVDEQGRVLRDNVWGPQHEDAARRDFTVNALYYDPVTEIVVDYHGGVKDIAKKTLRMIGEPDARYREDPVRIIRAVRFAAKTGFTIDAKTRAPIRECSALLKNIPSSRLFDEMIKLLQTGHSLESIKVLKGEGIAPGVLPLMDMISAQQSVAGSHNSLITLALRDTDARIAQGKGVSPSFLFGCMLWHEVQTLAANKQHQGIAAMPAFMDAADQVLETKADAVGIQRRIGGDMREIWLLQPRFERRFGKTPYSLLGSPRFRAGLDFYLLRCEAGELGDDGPRLAKWWNEFATADDERRDVLMKEATSERPQNQQQRSGPRRVPHTRTVAARSSSSNADSTTPVEASSDKSAETSSETTTSDPAKKRRRRRRKPGTTEEGSVPIGGDTGDRNT
jgi:poly(A) polymerase